MTPEDLWDEVNELRQTVRDLLQRVRDLEADVYGDEQ